MTDQTINKLTYNTIQSISMPVNINNVINLPDFMKTVEDKSLSEAISTTYSIPMQSLITLIDNFQLDIFDFIPRQYRQYLEADILKTFFDNFEKGIVIQRFKGPIEERIQQAFTTLEKINPGVNAEKLLLVSSKYIDTIKINPKYSGGDYLQTVNISQVGKINDIDVYSPTYYPITKPKMLAVFNTQEIRYVNRNINIKFKGVQDLISNNVMFGGEAYVKVVCNDNLKCVQFD